MSNSDKNCLYDKTHTIPIYDNTGQSEERNLNITIMNLEDILQIKLRDTLDYCFNYTENIDLGDFEVMRVNQNLDINFSEFRYNLIEMLQQFQKKEMFLKCETTKQKCTIIFYGKSKIKSIIFLMVDLHITNQKEIFSELAGNMQQIQDSNERLKKQLSNLRNIISNKDEEIRNLNKIRYDVHLNFEKYLKKIEDFFNSKLTEVENNSIEKLITTNKRIEQLTNHVDLIKKETIHMSDKSRRLSKTMENLQLDITNNISLINKLKIENNVLQTVKLNQEKIITDLRNTLLDKEAILLELQKKNDELQKHMNQTAIIISHKEATIDELSKDLVQANQMLVNFNNHYDNKAKQVEELETTLLTKEKIVKEQRLRINELLREFEEYKISFNIETNEKLQHELSLAHNKIQELEKSIRTANKINTLLTEKVNNQNMGFNNR